MPPLLALYVTLTGYQCFIRPKVHFVPELCFN